MPKLPLAKIEPALLNCPNTAALEAIAIINSVKKLSLVRAIARSFPVLDFGGNILFLVLVYAVTQDKNKRYVFLWICIEGDAVGGTQGAPASSAEYDAKPLSGLRTKNVR
ncbi:hypothetical protein [Thalassolituus sp.]|jgi:hypothetical protein|uniref:hypothetical protein n=1 Tax=Thalassolituus sp. TaxID=2030822 RepID=UPI002A828A1A|nr:hypothetical protein [Thalassolituus sp.]